MALERAISVINGKGGVTKTSVAVNLSGLAAHSGLKVLLVELDAQGNANRDLGTMDSTDRGEGLARSLADGVALEVLSDVRPNLDFVPGGPETEKSYQVLAALYDGFPAYERLEAVLATVSDDYDLIVLDCPPGEQAVQLAALTAARFALCPTKPDDGSIDGLTTVVSRALAVKQRYGKTTDFLGVVLTGVSRSATRVVAEAREEIERRSGGILPVYDTTIRFAEAPATACRRYGLLAHELKAAAVKQNAEMEAQMGKAWAVRLSKEERKAIRRLPDANGLAQDYRDLTEAVLADLASRHQEVTT
jgi:chromosome partitioning protein